ncbi:MAG: hypothetical protein ISS35_06950 [Kiritimatiellae bacterium]|nr:hypothetical protein [Kiritimatiellia bacterium]
MLNHLYIAEGAEGFFWIIVVIASIAGQIAKASKRAKQKQREKTNHAPAPRSNPKSGSPEDQLQDFLRSLTGQPPHVEPQPVAPAPPPVMKQPRPEHTSRTKQKKAHRKTHQPMTKTISPAGQATQPAVMPAMIQTDSLQSMQQATGQSALKRISAQRALRSAIVWKEILGPPVALKKRSAGR